MAESQINQQRTCSLCSTVPLQYYVLATDVNWTEKKDQVLKP